jgi:dinuclear metal center YbgI/SA1388 family protein
MMSKGHESRLRTIVDDLERVLNHASIGDYPGAQNGLQIENSGAVSRICAAVDACEPAFQQAAQVPGTLLLVHHGMLWSGGQPYTGALRRKLKLAFESDLALFSSHLPLDAHPVLGNNAQLAALLGVQKRTPAFVAKGQPIGFIGKLKTTRTALVQKLEKRLKSRIHIAPGGPERVQTIGICSGGSGGEVAEAAALGCDTFLCGEGPHHTYAMAEELGVNLIYAGHYATETLGVQALAEYAAKKFRLEWSFIDHPSGL